MVVRQWWIVRVVVGAAAALFLSAPLAGAQSVGERLVVLKVDFATKAYWLENLDGSHVNSRGHQQGSSLKNPSEVFLAKRNLARLVIVKTNPLAYAYASKADPPTNTTDFTAVSGFAEAIGALIKILGAPAPLNAAGQPLVTSDTEAVPPEVTVLRAHGFTDVAALNTFLDTFRRNTAALEAKTKEQEVLFTRSKTNQTEVKRVVCDNEPACTWGLTSIGKAIEDGFAKLYELEQAFLADPLTRFTPYPGTFSSVLRRADEIRKALRAAKAFAALVARIDEDVVLSNEAAYVASKDQPITVTRTDLLVDGTPSKQEASYRFVFRPDSPVTYGFGGDYVYSFVRPSTFSAVKRGDQLVIAETPGFDYKGTKIGAVLSISPTRWVGTPFTPVAEIGINTKTDKAKENTGFLLGVGFSPYGLFHFGGGVAFEQVPRLDGQNVGDVVESNDAIKTKLEFTRGWYLHVSVVKKVGS
jgi:hypothetical protein